MSERAQRLMFLVLGWSFVALGLLGVVLPLLPTTPFMLVALGCFARSSERFHGWLYHHRLFGPPLRQWEAHRVIPPSAKVAALTMMTASMIYMTFFAGMPWYLLAVASAAIAVGAWFVASTPSRVPEKRLDGTVEAVRAE